MIKDGIKEKIRFYFDTREEAIEFLEKYNVNCYVPKLKDKLRNHLDKNKKYFIKLKDKDCNEIEFGRVIAYHNDRNRVKEIGMDFYNYLDDNKN